jgi:hypothetical protein
MKEIKIRTWGTFNLDEDIWEVTVTRICQNGSKYIYTPIRFCSRQEAEDYIKELK